jgi:hypothetical protein
MFIVKCLIFEAFNGITFAKTQAGGPAGAQFAIFGFRGAKTALDTWSFFLFIKRA